MNSSLKVSDAEVAGKRAEAYGFFSQFYLEYLTPQFIETINNGSVLNTFSMAEGSEGYELLKKFVSVAKGIDNVQDELETEFSRLFCLSSGAGCHESIYLDKKQRVGGKCTMKVKKFYDKYAADISKDAIVIADHIGMELSFLDFLCKREAESRESNNKEIAMNCLDAQKEFIDNHICKWIDNFVSEVVEKAAYDFYKAIAFMTRDWLRDDREWLSEGVEGASV